MQTEGLEEENKPVKLNVMRDAAGGPLLVPRDSELSPTGPSSQRSNMADGGLRRPDKAVVFARCLLPVPGSGDTRKGKLNVLTHGDFERDAVQKKGLCEKSGLTRAANFSQIICLKHLENQAFVCVFCQSVFHLFI